MLSDAEIIRRILAGQIDLYSTLLARYERSARAAVLKVVRDRHLAEDVLQESFTAAYTGLASLRDRRRFGAWLIGIARRRGVSALERHQRIRPTGQNFELQADDRALTPMSLELVEVIEQLPEPLRIVIGLRYLDDHSVNDIAEFLGRPVGTITKQLSRARRRLHRLLTQENPAHEHATRS